MDTEPKPVDLFGCSSKITVDPSWERAGCPSEPCDTPDCFPGSNRIWKFAICLKLASKFLQLFTECPIGPIARMFLISHRRALLSSGSWVGSVLTHRPARLMRLSRGNGQRFPPNPSCCVRDAAIAAKPSRACLASRTAGSDPGLRESLWPVRHEHDPVELSTTQSSSSLRF